MTKRRATRSLITLTLATIMILTALSVKTPLQTVKAQGTTALKVVPQYTTVGQDGQPMPSQPITISIEVQDITDLVNWQVVLYYNPSFLYTQTNWLWIPSNNVFSGKGYAEMPATIGSDSYGSYIMKNLALYGSEMGFTGDGVLYKINFTAVTPGISHLAFSEDRVGGTVYINGSIPGYYQSFLWDSTFSDIKASAVEGDVEVKGTTVTKEPSVVTISADKSTVYLGSNVTMSGNVTLEKDSTPKPNVNVDINYRVAGTSENFVVLNTIKTNSEGHYNVTWTPTEQQVERFELYASWIGDDTTSGNQSQTINIVVVKPYARLWIQAVGAIGRPTLPVPLPTTPFSVNITVTNVTSLYSWQAKISYEPQYLELVSVTVPNEAFAWNKTVTTEGAYDYIFANATLTTPGANYTFSGNTTLVNIVFKGIAMADVTPTRLALIKEQTFLNYENKTQIPTTINEADIEHFIYIFGNIVKPQVSTKITLALSADTVYLGQSVMLWGNLTLLTNGTAMSDALVTIQYQSLDFTAWKTFAITTTNASGIFNYTWTPPKEPNEYTFRARFDGSSTSSVVFTASVSDEIVLTVTEVGAAGFDVGYYASIAALIFIAITDTSVTYLLLRKRPEHEKP